MRDPLRDPRALDVLRWVEFGETVIATVLDVRGDVVRLSLVYSGQQQYDEVLLADWPDWSGLDDVTVLRAADSPVPAAGRMTPAEIAAAPWWRWTRGLNSNRGLVVRVEPGRVAPQQIVRVLEDGYISEIRWEPRMGPLLPDLTDPLLPAWLLHLLRERTGPKANVTTYSEEAHWVVWVVRPGPAGRPRWERAGTGPTEIDALLAALQGVGS